MDAKDIALSVPSILNWRFGGGKGFERRESVGADETCHIVKNDDGTYSVLSPNKDTWLSIQWDGSFGERPSSNPPGSWEKFTRNGNVLTELPKENQTREPKSLIALS